MHNWFATFEFSLSCTKKWSNWCTIQHMSAQLSHQGIRAKIQRSWLPFLLEATFWLNLFCSSPCHLLTMMPTLYDLGKIRFSHTNLSLFSFGFPTTNPTTNRIYYLSSMIITEWIWTSSAYFINLLQAFTWEITRNGLTSGREFYSGLAYSLLIR